MSGNEGNIISFQVLIDKKGNLMTEYKHLPIEKISTVFDKNDTPFIQKIIREVAPKLDSLHEYLEKELSAVAAPPF